MRRLLGTLPPLLVLTLGLTACGSDDDGPSRATDENPPATETISPTTPEASPDVLYVEKRVIAIVHQTAAGGTVTEEAVPIGNDAELDDFVAQFRTPGMREQIAGALDASAAEPYAAVISIGCDVPPGAEVEGTDEGTYLVTPHKVPDPLPNCLAPVTSVAVIANA